MYLKIPIIYSILTFLFLGAPLAVSGDTSLVSLLHQLEGKWVCDSSGIYECVLQSAAVRDTLCGDPWTEENIQELARHYLDDYVSNGPLLILEILPLQQDSVPIVGMNNKGKAYHRALVAFTVLDSITVECEYAPFPDQRVEDQRMRFQFRYNYLCLMQRMIPGGVNCEPKDSAQPEMWFDVMHFRRPTDDEAALFVR